MKTNLGRIKAGRRLEVWVPIIALALGSGCGADSNSNFAAPNLSQTGPTTSPSPEVVPLVGDPTAYVAYLQRLARQQGVPWTPELKPLFADPTFNPGAWLGADAPTVAARLEDVRTRDLGLEATMPRVFRWDNQNGVNFMTPVKTQTDPRNQAEPRDFGTCIAFATIGCLESKVNILADNPLAAPDLSEWHLYSRSGRPVSSKQGAGWQYFFNGTGSLEVLRDEGAVIESVFPYSLIPTRPGLSNATFRWRITNPRRVAPDVTDIKQEVLKGPVLAIMQVYTDFFSYSGNSPYRRLAGPGIKEEGYHAVCIIGWDENDSSWICRNSWGTGWGNQGNFKIEYGQVGIESLGVTAFDLSASQTPPSTVAYVGRNSANTADVYASRRASGRSEQQSSPALGINAELSTKVALTPDASAMTHMSLTEQLANSGLLSPTWNFLNNYQLLVPDLSPSLDNFWYHPAWSRNGDQLAFIREGSSTQLAIYQISQGDNNPSYVRNTRVLKSGGRLRGASFSPDGTQILTSDRLSGPGGAVVVVNVTDGSSRTIKQGTESELVLAGDRNGWSGRLPDGSSKILYTRVLPGPIFRTLACNPDGSGEQLVREQNFYGEFSWIASHLPNPASTILGKIAGQGYSLGRHDQGPNSNFAPLNAFQLPGEPAGQSGAELYLNSNDTNL